MVIFTGITVSPRPLLHPPTERTRHSDLNISRQNFAFPSRKSNKRRTLIAKFGGTSLNSSRRIARAAKAVAKEYARGAKLVVVVSAVGRTTDRLLELTNQTQNIVDHDKDDILAMGERTSARIFSASLKSFGIQARYFDPSDRDWPIITDDKFSQANPIRDKCIARIRRYVKPLLDNGIVPVIAGFIGRTADGRVSTLGRGGSDTTALILASALKADEVVLVTSSPGVMSGDPRLVRQPRLLRRIDMRTLSGMADSGTKFIHSKALRFKEPDINIRVVPQASGDLRAPGTIISGGPMAELEVAVHNPDPVASVTLVGRSLPKDPNLMGRVARIARRDLVAVSQDSDSVILYLKETSSLRREIAALHKAVLSSSGGVAIASRTGTTLISVKGVGLEQTPGVTARISQILGVNNINIFGIITITSSVLILVAWRDRRRAARLIRNALEVT